MSHILVTGGAGYIGSMLVSELLWNHHKVHVIDNFTYDQHHALAHYYSHKNFTCTNEDVRSLSRDYYSEYDIIIPLAALVGAPLCDKKPVIARSVNKIAICDMLDNLKNQLVIFPNTNSGYGSSGTEPVTEDTPLAPISVYGETKRAAEKAVLQYKNSIVFRLATVFGVSPRHRMDLLVNEFVWKAVKEKSIVLFEPNFRRNFIHIRDVADAFIHAIINSDLMCGNVYNVGDTRANMTKRQLCEKIKEHVPSFEIMEASTHSDPDKRDYLVSNAKIEATGWLPAYTIDDGIRELMRFYNGFKQFQYGNV